jgi:hypothetical protein
LNRDALRRIERFAETFSEATPGRRGSDEGRFATVYRALANRQKKHEENSPTLGGLAIQDRDLIEEIGHLHKRLDRLERQV